MTNTTKETTTTKKSATTRKGATIRNTPKKSNSSKGLTFNERLIKVIDAVNKSENKTAIDGGFYTTVRTRLLELRKEFGLEVKILTKLINADDRGSHALFETQISFRIDGEWELLSNGHAQDLKNASEMNQINYLENAETSSVGRALANLGIDGGNISEAELEKQKTNKGTKKAATGKSVSNSDEKITSKQIKEINSLLKESDDFEEAKEGLLKSHNVTKLEDLSKEKADETIDILKSVSDTIL